jgi:hypothetical protein
MGRAGSSISSSQSGSSGSNSRDSWRCLRPCSRWPHCDPAVGPWHRTAGPEGSSGQRRSRAGIGAAVRSAPPPERGCNPTVDSRRHGGRRDVWHGHDHGPELWLGIGLHLGWNFTASYVFSAVVSGHESRTGLIFGNLSGPDWMTGGAFGIEGSAVTLRALVAGTSLLAAGRPLTHISNHLTHESRF